MPELQKEVWVAGIQENPVPDSSFVSASTDKSEYVGNNTLHLAEAGINPDVYEDYFQDNEDDLPLQKIKDIPNEVVLKTYSTARTRHRNLQDIELQYNKRQSIIDRHRTSLSTNLGKRAAWAWAPEADDEFNKIINLGANASVIDAIIDLEAFYADLDKNVGLNICLTTEHMARIKKENKVLYKEVLDTKMMYGFKVWRYTQNPIYTADGVKKPFGATKVDGDKKASFAWCTDEVFRCFGDTEMYATLGSASTQADEISFGQRALVGNIRANSPKYLGAIL